MDVTDVGESAPCSWQITLGELAKDWLQDATKRHMQEKIRAGESERSEIFWGSKGYAMDVAV